MNLRTLVSCALVGALGLVILPAVASADDFMPPPWDRADPFAITAEWEFLAPAPVVTAIMPDGPLTNVGLKGSGTIPGGTSFASVTADGVWGAGDGDGKWDFPTGGVIHFEIDNIVDFYPVKHMWVQVTHDPLPPLSALSVVPLFAFDNVVGFGTVQTPVSIHSPDPSHTLFHWDIFPNPDWEEFDLIIPGTSTGGSGPGIGIDQVVVDTISVPVPAALPAGLVLLGGVFVLHRRRRGR